MRDFNRGEENDTISHKKLNENWMSDMTKCFSQLGTILD